MNMWQTSMLSNLLTNELPRLCRALPEIVVALNQLCVEIKELRAVLEEVERTKHPKDE